MAPPSQSLWLCSLQVCYAMADLLASRKARVAGLVSYAMADLLALRKARVAGLNVG